MTIEIALLISGVSLAFGIYEGIASMKRNNRNDTKADATQLTTVIVKLEKIGDDIKEIKSDMRDLKDDIQNHAERLVKIEQQLKVLNNAVFKKGDISE